VGTLPDKWTAFWLSLVLPGAGQLAARSWWAAVWIAAGVGLGVLLAQRQASGAAMFDPLAIFLLGTLGLLSAEHAKRLREPRRREGAIASPYRCLSRRVVCEPAAGRSLSVRMSLDFPCSAEELWLLVADLPRFLTLDPFHDRVTLQQLPAARGVDLVLSHNAFGWRFLRFGKILAWNAGRGYTVSDLSARDPQVGFPHAFLIRIAPAEPNGSEPRSTLTIRVRGRWNSPFIPPYFGRLWVTWVCREHARLLAKGL
jgi:hypothetical protein